MPSRLVICDRPLTEFATLYHNPDSGFPAARMNMMQIANAGLVKFNVINSRALSIIQRTLQEVAQSGVTIDIERVGFEDESTYDLLSSGAPSCIEMHDHELFRNTLLTIKPRRFEDLAAVVALSQPYLHKCASPFAEAASNPQSIQHFHPALAKITAETHGLILYQEQVMQIAHELAGFTMAQADSFRRTVRSGRSGALNACKPDFIAGVVNHGISAAEATSLFDHTAQAERRSFTKAHAVAYAILTYREAWLRANYPHEFEYAAAQFEDR